MVNLWMITTFVALGLLFLFILVVAVFLYMYPTVLALITSRSLVWEVSGTGNFRARPAKELYGALKTKKGVYFYEKLDVVTCHGKNGIIVNESNAKALRPDIQPVLSLMKRLNIKNRESIAAILSLPLVTKEQYDQMIEEENMRKQMMGA
jgi:hypothetical protein